jgi:hypothetical protein
MDQVVTRAGLEHGEQVGREAIAQGVRAERAQKDGQEPGKSAERDEDHVGILAW